MNALQKYKHKPKHFNKEHSLLLLLFFDIHITLVEEITEQDEIREVDGATKEKVGGGSRTGVPTCNEPSGAEDHHKASSKLDKLKDRHTE